MTQEEAQRFVREAVLAHVRRPFGQRSEREQEEDMLRGIHYSSVTGKLFDEGDGSTFVVEVRELT